MNIIDLPGTYSLTANSVEEQIARDYLVKESPDVVVAIFNAASLERSLYLLAELIELSPRLVIGLNMIDVAQQQGMKIDSKALASTLDIPVVPIIATKNRGLDELVKTIEHVIRQPVRSGQKQHVEYGSEVKGIIDHVESLLSNVATEPYPKHWTAMKLLEGDEKINRLIKERISSESRQSLDSFLKENESMAVSIATLRFEWVAKNSCDCPGETTPGASFFN